MTDMLEVVGIVIMYVVAPILAMISSIFMFRRYKRTPRNTILFIAVTFVSSLIAYEFGQLFIPLTYIAQFVITFVASWFVAKFSIRDSILFAMAFVGLTYLFTMTLLFLFGILFVIFQPNPTNP